MADDAPKPTDAPADDLADLDIEAQLDHLAAELQFDLDDDPAPPKRTSVGSNVEAEPEPESEPEPEANAEANPNPTPKPDRSLDPPTEEIDSIEELADDDSDLLGLAADDELVGLDEDPQALDDLLPEPTTERPDVDDFDDDDDDAGDNEIEELDAEDLMVDGGGTAVADPTRGRPLYLSVDGRATKVDKDRFVIGRVSKMCDLPIIDVNISRQHCAVERRDDGYYIVDLGSTNGIVLEGTRVDGHKITEGEVFVLSGHEVRASFFAPLPEARPASVREPSREAREPAVTARHEPVPTTEPARPAIGARKPAQPIASVADRVEERPITQVPITAPGEDRSAAVSGVTSPGEPVDTFETRVEQRLEQLSQQIAYLQQSMQALMHTLAPLAQMVNSRVAQKQRGR